MKEFTATVRKPTGEVFTSSTFHCRSLEEARFAAELITAQTNEYTKTRGVLLSVQSVDGREVYNYE